MKIPENKVEFGSRGEDVKLLHVDLVQLGFVINKEELAQAYFGPSTLQAVTSFQRKIRTISTGKVDKRTAAQLNEELRKIRGRGPQERSEKSKSPAEDRSLIVRGHVRRADGTPMSGLIVRAYDRDLPSLKRDQVLGQPATTSAEGYYEITYTSEQFAAAERGSADLYVRVYRAKGKDPEAHVLATSDTRFNSKPVEIIDVVLINDQYGGPSEFERMMRVFYGSRAGHAHRYLCRGNSDTGGKTCIGAGGIRVDCAVGAQILEAVSGHAIEAAVQAAERFRAVDDDVRLALAKELEAARYEACLAARRYELVDPAKRLVARELEGRWNNALERVHQLECRISGLEGQALRRPQIDREALLALAHDLQAQKQTVIHQAGIVDSIRIDHHRTDQGTEVN